MLVGGDRNNFCDFGSDCLFQLRTQETLVLDIGHMVMLALGVIILLRLPLCCNGFPQQLHCESLAALRDTTPFEEVSQI